MTIVSSKNTGTLFLQVNPPYTFWRANSADYFHSVSLDTSEIVRKETVDVGSDMEMLQGPTQSDCRCDFYVKVLLRHENNM